MRNAAEVSTNRPTSPMEAFHPARNPAILPTLVPPGTQSSGPGMLPRRAPQTEPANKRTMNRFHAFHLVAACLATLASTPAARGNTQPPADLAQPAPLFDNLGRHTHPITTRHPQAQRYFNQGMVLLYGFNHDEAIRAFHAAASLDPKTPMPHWGIAYAHGPNINRPMDDTAVPKAWAALQQAKSLAANGNPREQAYIAALEHRYAQQPPQDRAPLDRAYAEAMRELMRRFPDDLDAATLFAEAVLDTMPWDYWQPDRRPKPATQEAIAVIRNVLRRDPDHPGALHFFIHLIEPGPTPEDALAAADRLRALNLGAAHLVHMPSHIYLRTGQYADAIEVNRLAAAMDKQYIRDCRAQGFYPAAYYPHNLHFLWFAQMMVGASRDSLATAREIMKLEQDVRCGPSALVEAPRFRHLALITHARFGQWAELAAEPEPARDQPLDRAAWHYTRAVADLATRKVDSAAAHLQQLSNLAASDSLKALDNPALPATSIVGVAQRLLAGRLALARGETSRGIDHLRAAVQLEDEIPYMEPPYWHAPVRQTLGAALLAADHAVDAEAVFRADLERNPRNAWSLFGLIRSLRDQGRTEAAEAVEREFKGTWIAADTRPDLAWY